MYKLRSWIDINKINWDFLSENPNATPEFIIFGHLFIKL